MFIGLWVCAGFVIGYCTADYLVAMVDRKPSLRHEIGLGFVGALTAYTIVI